MAGNDGGDCGGGVGANKSSSGDKGGGTSDNTDHANSRELNLG